MDNKTRSRSRSSRPRDPEATRRALLDAGADAFARHGFAGARLDRIAVAARVNKALIRYHFGGKRGLYNAVLLEGLTAGREELDRLLADPAPAGDAGARLGRLISTFARFYDARPDLALLLTREQMDGARNLERATLDALFAFFGATRRLLEEGIGSGRLRALDPHHVHLALVGSLLFFRLTAPARASYQKRGLLAAKGTTPLAWADHVEVVRAIALHGLALPSVPTTSNASDS